EEGRALRQRGDQDLSRRQPVLDLQQGRIPEEPGLFARLPAGKEPRAVGLDSLHATKRHPRAGPGGHRFEEGWMAPKTRDCPSFAIVRSAQVGQARLALSSPVMTA